MAIYKSAELRWFYKGDIPDEALQWYHSKSIKSDLEFTEPRTDTYLLFNNSRYCGVKLREGNFEVKTYVESDGIYNNVPIQIWEKWSHDIDNQKGFLKSILNDDNTWADVTKTRKLIFFQFQDSLEEVTKPNYENGTVCQLELARINFQDNNWCSLNMEVAGQENLPSYLRQAAEILLKDCVLELSHRNAYSYPSWLQKFYQTNL